MKNIVLIILIVLCLPIGAQSTVGTKITSTVVPNDSLDDIATHADIFGQGGYRSVSTIEERNEIKTSRRKIGMLVYVQADSATYILKNCLSNSCWSMVKSKADTITSLKRLTITGSDTIPINATNGGTYFAVTKNGGLISGIGHDSVINETSQLIIGRNNSQRGREGIAIGTSVKNYGDSSILIGKYLSNSNRSSILIGRGISDAKPLQSSSGDALMFGYKDSVPSMTISRDTVNVRGRLLVNGTNLVELWQNNAIDTIRVTTPYFVSKTIHDSISYYIKRVEYRYSASDINSNITRTIVSAPSGKYINPLSITLIYVHLGVAFTTNTSVLLKIGTYTIAGGGINLGINTANTKFVPIIGLEQNLAASTPVTMDGKAMTISMSGTNTTGTNYIKVVVLYSIENVL